MYSDSLYGTQQPSIFITWGIMLIVREYLYSGHVLLIKLNCEKCATTNQSCGGHGFTDCLIFVIYELNKAQLKTK